MALLTKARKRQPELAAALIWRIKNRPSNFNHLRQVEEKAHKKEQTKTQKHIEKASHKKTEQLQTEKIESLFTRAPDDISQEEALARFRRLKEEDRARRQFQELKEIS
jgi:aryl-alcohol dehydrogenase-like predicted oxidoreductase